MRLAPDLQGALLCLDPATGDVLAVVGGVDFKKSPYNRAFYAKRQPGSALKPLIYAAALNAGQTASSLWDDTPVSYHKGNGERWTPIELRKEIVRRNSLAQGLGLIQ